MPDVNLKANTPINAPKIISMYWSLIATAVVMLSIERNGAFKKKSYFEMPTVLWKMKKLKMNFPRSSFRILSL